MEPTSANFQQPTRRAPAALEWSLIMLIQKTPSELGPLCMLGTTAYPLYLVCGRSEGASSRVESVPWAATEEQFQQLGVGPDTCARPSSRTPIRTT